MKILSAFFVVLSAILIFVEIGLTVAWLVIPEPNYGWAAFCFVFIFINVWNLIMWIDIALDEWDF